VDGELRASLAVTRASAPLGEVVAGLAARAVAGDPRFRPVAPGDAGRLSVRVTVLGAPRRLTPAAAVHPAEEAVLVRQGWHRGLSLPSVARAAGWDAATCLAQACVRAGLPARAHAGPDATVEALPALELDPA
jgi:AMMECR1 domain-containing protein